MADGTDRDDGDRGATSGAALAVGMLTGAILGFALWIATDTFVFFPTFLAIGGAAGLALHRARDEMD